MQAYSDFDGFQPLAHFGPDDVITILNVRILGQSSETPTVPGRRSRLSPSAATIGPPLSRIGGWGYSPILIDDPCSVQREKIPRSLSNSV